MKSADELRRVADIIDGFPKYIRRDVGSVGLQRSVEALLEPFELSDNRALVEAIITWSSEIRRTQVKYFMGQFDDAA